MLRLQNKDNYSSDFNTCYFNENTQHQRHFIPATIRGNSISPSSGYESLNDNVSSYSGEYTPRSRNVRRKNGYTKLLNATVVQTETQASVKRRASSSIDCNGAGTPSSKRRKFTKSEYIVESIESLESINGFPVFFVKWLNYPSEQNTWESMDNLAECELLTPFIEQQYEFFDVTISAITAEIETEIENQSLTYETSKLDVKNLDEYEPLLLKADLILLAQFRDSGSKSQKEPEKIRKRVIAATLLKPFYYLRIKQLKDLQAWQECMNDVEHAAPISVENNCDLEVLDLNFQYIKDSIAGVGVRFGDSPPIGCKCEDGCAPLSKCCARLADSYFAYEKNGRLRIRSGEAIYECNSTCACDEACVNRVIQRGRQNELCLFKTPNGCGWGVRTEQIIRKGEFVCEYVGEIITTDEANERGKKYDAIGRTYLFDLDYNTSAESVYTIDAAMHGNISHFINHSCDPNLAVFPFWINNLDVNMPRLAFFTLRGIKAGEELTFDYIRGDENADDYTNLSEAEKVTCRCGTENCRKVLF